MYSHIRQNVKYMLTVTATHLNSKIWKHLRNTIC